MSNALMMQQLHPNSKAFKVQVDLEIYERRPRWADLLGALDSFEDISKDAGGMLWDSIYIGAPDGRVTVAWARFVALDGAAANSKPKRVTQAPLLTSEPP